MSGDADLLAPIPETPAADAAPPVIEVVKPPEDEGEPEGIDAPDGEKYVKLSAVTSARAKAKELRTELETVKAEVGKGAEKDQRIAQLESQLQQVTPYAQAYQAAVEAQRNQPQPVQEDPAEKAELEDIAKDLDFYKTDGSLDLDRAKRVHARETARAQRIAQQYVEPFAQQTVADKSMQMLERALITKTPDGSQPDPEVLKEIWKRLDTKLTATPAGAAQAFSVALGHSVLLGKHTSKKAPEVIPDPLVIEKAGGKDVAAVALRDSDKRIARDLGMTDKEYAAQLAEMPNGWGKGA